MIYLQEFHKAHVSELENRLRLEKVNRDTAEARHTSEVQKCNGRIKYLEDVTRMCQVCYYPAMRSAESCYTATSQINEHVKRLWTCIGTCVYVCSLWLLLFVVMKHSALAFMCSFAGAAALSHCTGNSTRISCYTARRVQEGADLSSKRADDLAEQLQDCKTKLEAAQQDHNKLKDAAATHEKLAAQAQETVTTLQAEVTEVRYVMTR